MGRVAFWEDGAWSQSDSKLVGTGATGNAQQGTSIALSENGTAYTLLEGGPADNGNTGAAWLYTAPVCQPITIVSTKIDAQSTYVDMKILFSVGSVIQGPNPTLTGLTVTVDGLPFNFPARDWRYHKNDGSYSAEVFPSAQAILKPWGNGEYLLAVDAGLTSQLPQQVEVDLTIGGNCGTTSVTVNK
jgi:hypothetical protein